VPQVGLADVWPASLPGRHDRAPWAGRPVPSGSGRVEPVAVRLGSPAGAERSAKVSAAEEAQSWEPPSDPVERAAGAVAVVRVVVPAAAVSALGHCPASPQEPQVLAPTSCLAAKGRAAAVAAAEQRPTVQASAPVAGEAVGAVELS